MNCQQAENYIYKYCDANLSPELCLQLEEHLKVCKHCCNLVELTRMENAVLKDALALDYLDDHFTRRVMNAVSARSMASTIDHKPVTKTRGKRPYWYYATAAAIVLLFTAFAPGIYNNLFNLNSQMDVAIKDTARNQETVDKALEIAKREKIIAGAAQPESAKIQSFDAGTVTENVVNAPSTNEVEYYSSQNDSPASTDQNTPVEIAMIDAPVAEILQDTNGITRSASSVASKTTSPNPNRYRSYAVSVADSLEDYSHMPIDLPNNYVLEKSLNADSAVVYIYSESNSNQAVELSIEPYTTATADILTLAESDIKSGKESVAQPLPQHLEVIFEYENTKYLVKLKSSLSTEELLKLAKEIRLGQQ